MAKPTPTTYGLLGMLAARSWTGYELTQQVRRSLRFVWPSSEGHLYREQKRLVALGWATLDVEADRRRTRNRYTITPAGQSALKKWLATQPGEPRFEIEGILRMFYADQGTSQDLVNSLRATATSANEMLNEMLAFANEYLADGGPLWMLENSVGGPEQERLEYNGRVQYPERLHVVARVIDITTRLLANLVEFAQATADEAADWPTPTDPALTNSTRQVLETIRDRNIHTNH
jgi:PadR family transcriptional regulator, regulatory protein AphA